MKQNIIFARFKNAKDQTCNSVKVFFYFLGKSASFEKKCAKIRKNLVLKNLTTYNDR